MPASTEPTPGTEGRTVKKWLINPKEWKRQLQAEAAAKAINKGNDMLEEELGVKGKGSTPSKRRRSVINKLKHKLDRQ